MPIYDFSCTICGNTQESIRSIADRFQGPVCEQCGGLMEYQLSAPPKPTDHLYPYLEENFDHKPVEIKSLRHYRREQKRRGLVDNGRPRGVKGQWV